MSLPPYPGGSDNPEGQQPPPQYGQGQQPPPPYGQQQGQYPPPYGQQQPPYGQQQPPYGQTPYGQGQWSGPGGYGSYQGPNDATGQSYSGLAIAALVLSFTCVLSWLGVVLGIAGIFRTGAGKAKGRWMAVTAIIVGLVFSALLAGLAAGGVWLGRQFVTPGNAEVGQCVEIEHDGRNVSLFKTDCSEPHNGQVFAVHELTDSDIDDLDAGRTGQLEYCAVAAADQFGVSPAPTITVDGERVSIEAVLDDPDDPQAGDELVCLIETSSGTVDRSLVD